MEKEIRVNGYAPKICILGAGLSGMLAGIKLKTELGFENYTIFDENADVGGAWMVNTYPGCACDVESHLYSYSFELNPNWSHMYAPQPEIQEYLKNLAHKYNLYHHLKFNSQVKRMVWNEDLKKWRVTVLDKVTKTTDELLFDLVINGYGPLRVPNFPDEFKNFKGQMIHTALWDSSVEFENKTVAVVGSGASAIQIIPVLAEKSKELHCYQRTPAWVLPRKQFKFPKWVQWMFGNIPFLMVFFRWFLFLLHEMVYHSFLYGSYTNKTTTWVGKKLLNHQVPDDKTLREKLTPGYGFGCKRTVVSSEYYPAINRPNVYLHTEPIKEVKDHSISTTEQDRKIDVLVLATGYRIQDYFAPLEIIGKNSQDVMEHWQNDRPHTYLGIVSAILPNQFILMGPSTALAHNSLLFMIECQMHYVVQLLKEFFRRKAEVIVVKESTENEFHHELDRKMKKTVWGHEKCGSWYANMRGIITILWPNSGINYWRKTRVPDFSKFNFY